MPRSAKPDNDRHSATPAGSTRLPSLPLRRRRRSAETDSVGPLASLRRVAAEHTGPWLFVVAIVLAAVFIASTDAAGTTVALMPRFARVVVRDKPEPSSRTATSGGKKWEPYLNGRESSSLA